MKTNHTTGPWRIAMPDDIREPIRVIKQEDHPQGDLTICHVNPHLNAESIDNARLIASAPDMLETLRAIAEEYHALQRSQGAAANIGEEFTAGEWIGSRLGGLIAKVETLAKQ